MTETVKSSRLLMTGISAALLGSAAAGDHHPHRHVHNHWNLITHTPENWPPACQGELVDEGVTHAHALLSANREIVQTDKGLRDWIIMDANTYDPDLLHVNSKADTNQAELQIYESHFFTCYSLVFDEDGEQMGYDKSKTFSYELEVPAQSWQIVGNTRAEINAYLKEHGFQVEEEPTHTGGYQVVDRKERAQLIDSLVQNRLKKDTKQKTTKREPTRQRTMLDFDIKNLAGQQAQPSSPEESEGGSGQTKVSQVTQQATQDDDDSQEERNWSNWSGEDKHWEEDEDPRYRTYEFEDEVEDL